MFGHFVAMKLWTARSGSYETYFFNALSRSLFTNSSWIFATSLFVKTVGPKGFPQLYFFASIGALLYYAYFVFRGNKGEEPYNVYKVVMVLALTASVGCFMEAFTPSLQPFHAYFLYFLIVSVMTVDLIDTTLGPIVLQASVDPAIFRSVYQRMIVTAEVIARIAGAGLIWILSQGHVLNFIYPVTWVMLVSHFILFGATIRRMRQSELKTGIERPSPPPIVEAVSKSLRFMFSNQLVRVAMVVMVWSTLTRFVLEYLFYQVADARFGSAREIASFVSAMTMSIYVLSLFTHHFVSRTLNVRLQLSTLLSIQPINIVCLGALALLLPPFWPLVLLMVTYNIIHRSIQLPTSRQCLVPVPRTQRGIIVSMISIVVAVATLITSGSMAALKNVLHLQDFLVIFLFFGLAIFFMITRLDSLYIRNLWSFMREARSGNWQSEPQSDSLSAAVLESPSTIDDGTGLAISNDLHRHPILETYAFSSDKSKLCLASNEHRQLLNSDKPELLVAGLRICFVTGFPWFAEYLSQAAAHEHQQVREFAKKAVAVNKEFAQMKGYSSAFRRRIKSVAMELSDARPDREWVSTLTGLIDTPLSDHGNAESLIAVMADSRFKTLRDVMLKCIAEQGARLTVTPIVERMYQSDYENAHVCRQALEQLSFGKSNPDLRSTIETNLSKLNREQLCLGQQPDDEHMPQLQIFMHTLFLEEYRLSPRKSDAALIHTISEFQIFSPEERAILIDMHLSFLKEASCSRAGKRSCPDWHC